MSARRKFSPAIAARLLAIHAELDALSQKLSEATAKELATCSSPKEAEAILDRFVAQLVAKLDAEAVKLGLPADYFNPPTVH